MIWVVPLLPALGFVVNGLFGTRFLTKKAVAWIACSAVLLSFLLSLGAILALNGVEGLAPAPGLAVDHNAHRVTLSLYTWMPMGRSETGENLSVDWSYSLDPLSAVMLLVVTGVGFLIHVYSVGYMEHEPGPAYARCFSYLNLFMAMMLTLVLGASLPVVFVGWEGVGLCSYLLIGFYYDRMFDEKTRMSCADAGRKAFITNRIGDVGFILGMLLLFVNAGTLDIQGILAKTGTLGPGVCTAAAHTRSEEHTSELQSPYELVCRLLLEKKNKRSLILGSWGVGSAARWAGRRILLSGTRLICTIQVCPFVPQEHVTPTICSIRFPSAFSV